MGEERASMGIGDEVRARRYGVRFSAQRQFTNRDAEKALFNAKLDEVRSVRQRRDDWATDVESPRQNVIAFYGYGGIGKTRLSQELERDFVEAQDQATRRLAVRVDFSEPSARDGELYLFTLRAGLARLTSAFPAFDTLLALYWTRRHPGTSMAEFVRHQSVLGGLADRATLAEHLREFTWMLVGSVGPAVDAARRLASISWENIQGNRTVRRLERDCPFFRPCVDEDDMDELRLHLPLLLAWDLARLKGKGDVEIAIFLDTFEHVSHGRRRARKGDLEDAIARSAFFLPSVTFVVTSRNKLTWGAAESSLDLEHSGPDTWPGLIAPTSPDQHEVGVFPTADCEDHLARCLVDEDSQPAIPVALRREIAQLSSGIPLYLDVAANHFYSLVAAGRVPSLDDFAAGIPEIVTRLMENLDDEETDLLRIAALLGVFDAQTLRAALPDVRSSTVERFLRRTFVLDRGDDMFSIHELLQTSVRSQDAATSNPWSPEEWRQTETLLVGYWSRHFQDKGANLWRDRRTQALAFWQLCGLHATTEVDTEILAEVILLVHLRGSWATVEAGTDQPASLVNQRGVALLQVLDGLLARYIGNLENAETLLSEALELPALTGQVRRLAQYYLGSTLDVQGHSPAGIFSELARVDDRLGAEARLAQAQALIREGDLTRALTIAEGFTVDEEEPELAYRLHELFGVVWLFAGEFARGVEQFDQCRRIGEARQSAYMLALALRHLCLTLCWKEPDRALALLDDAETLNSDLRLAPGIGQCLLARAVATIGKSPLEVSNDLLARSEAAFSNAGYQDDALAPVAVGVLAAAAVGDDELANARRQNLIACSQGRRPRTWLAAADVWTGNREHFEQVTWPQGSEKARGDWEDVLISRSESHPTQSSG